MKKTLTLLVCLLALVSGNLLLPAAWAQVQTTPPAGLKKNTPNVFALTDARVVVSPDRVLPRATVVIRGSTIVAVGAEVTPPPDATVIPCRGKTIYPGLVDAYSVLEFENSQAADSSGYWNRVTLPHVLAAEHYRVDRALNKKLRGQGIAMRLVVPARGVVRGQSAWVTTADGPLAAVLVEPQAALHVQLVPDRRAGRRQYPNSPMGAVALVRQVFYDARWYAQAWQLWRQQPDLPQPERSQALEALAPYLEGKPVVMDAPDELYALRAHRLGREFGLRVILRGSGNEYRRLRAVRATGRGVILPLEFPKPPDVTRPELARAVSLEELMHWDLAPENPARLARAGVPIAFCTWRLSGPEKFLAQLRKAVARGLSPRAALRALTLEPLRWFGLDRHYGTIEAGKAASLVVTDGDLFSSGTRVLETWVRGTRYVVRKPAPRHLAGTWHLELTDPEGKKRSLQLALKLEKDKPSATLRLAKQEEKIKDLKLEHYHLRGTASGKLLGSKGRVRISLTLIENRGRTQLQQAQGELVWPSGRRSSLRLVRFEPAKPKPPTRKKKQQPQRALYEPNYPLGAYGRTAPPPQPRAVLFRGATVWTCGPQGVLKNASVLVVRGRIAAVGRDVKPPEGALVVDCRGKHITPGIIDCHSHIATDGGVNESAQTITAEVRIGDFIDPDDINIYRQLAGGVTAANILHGSANTIGGQNQVIKFRWGQLDQELKFRGAPPGIKFALGENVKQSNWGDQYTTRYPQTRMGVDQLIQDAFRRAQDYRRKWQQWRRRRGRTLPPRRDLELEALVEVLEGRRLIHCHSYRQSEILALLRTCERFGVRVGTLQHILEGYKVADVMAAHGAGGSSFSDWWIYKFEVYDAIPYNGALMYRAGVLVSFNSDSAELGRHLNTEAAKAVKYGRVPVQEALKFVTLNPARQLGIDRRVGSLQRGKDADLVVWSGPPLSTLSVCEQTWIDGRKYFDRREDLKARERFEQMRQRLIQRILTAGEEPRKPGQGSQDPDTLWPRYDVFCSHCQSVHEAAEPEREGESN